MPESKHSTVNGWYLFAHPLFLDQVEELVTQVERLKKKDPTQYRSKNAAKRLAAIYKLIYEIIPQDPTLPEYRQGNTLGEQHKHWFRAKFFQQYRLFFRFHRQSKIIVFTWVNNDQTKRAYNSKSDAYSVFQKMLGRGNPPDDWKALLKQAKEEAARFTELTDNPI